MEDEEELRRLEEIAILSSIYNRNERKFQRNPNLSHVVHAFLNFAQFSGVFGNELFHHIHHAINRKLREKDSTIPNLPEERNPIFFSYPICMIVSLVLSVLWTKFRNYDRMIDATLVGCAIGILLTLLSAVSSMRHAEIYINLEEVSDDELLTHPIFIHNFIMCIISIFAMLLYLIHFWILFEFWHRRKTDRAAGISSSSSQSQEQDSQEPSTSRKSEPAEKLQDTDSILTFEALKSKLLKVDEENWEDNPETLYCCCVDLWNYIEERGTRIPDHEFQVVHVK